MRIVEILLPKGTSDRSLSPQTLRKIDALQKRMDGYVDKIMDPKTSAAGKEFLKSRLRDDYYDLKDTIPRVHKVAENEEPIKYEVYDRKTGERVSGPYSNSKRARTASDKKDLEYGAIRYGIRPVGQKLEELFAGGKRWDLSFSGSEEYIAEFRVGDVLYTFHAYKPEPTKEPTWWDVEFKVNMRGHDIKAKFGVTGTGNSAEVFSTVVDIMRDFMHRNKDIDKITMSAKEPSRQRLYKTMIARLLPDWSLEADGIEFTITRPKGKISEAVTKLPLTHKDFEVVIEVMKRPIPAAIAPIYILEIIEDDELNDQLMALEDSDPGMDVRPIIAEWFNRVMPDQMYRFRDDGLTTIEKNGSRSPIHGYDSHFYKGTSEAQTGNAYGHY